MQVLTRLTRWIQALDKELTKREKQNARAARFIDLRIANAIRL